MQPGETITPGNSPQPNPTPATTEPVEHQEAAPAPQPQIIETHDEPRDTGPGVSWTASEYIAHQKGMSWYVLLGLGAALLAGIVFVVTKDLVSTVVTSLGVIMLGVFAARQPRVLSYQLSQQGVQAGQKFYPYVDFKSFSVQENGGISSVLFTSMKRFMPGLTIYYPPDQEEDIINFVADYLPHEELAVDPIDRFMRKVRF